MWNYQSRRVLQRLLLFSEHSAAICVVFQNCVRHLLALPQLHGTCTVPAVSDALCSLVGLAYAYPWAWRHVPP